MVFLRTFEEAIQVEFKHLVNFLKLFRSNASYQAVTHSEQQEKVLKLVELLWSLDYTCMNVVNTKGVLCEHYPARLIIPDTNRDSITRQYGVKLLPEDCRQYHPSETDITPASDKRENNPKMIQGDTAMEFVTDRSVECPMKMAIMDMHGCIEGCSPITLPKWMFMGDAGIDLNYTHKIAGELEDIFKVAKYGRSRNRFVVPAILYRNKYICRSSTVPLLREVVLRMGVDALYTSMQHLTNLQLPPVAELMEGRNTGEKENIQKEINNHENGACEDVKILNKFDIGTIFDLMVEQGKVKWNITCSSSEKAEPENYKGFKINIIPYPGCEFFKQFKDNNMEGENLYFDWSHPEIDAKLSIQDELKTIQKDWAYQTWPLTHLTRVYVMALLKLVKESDSGVLVHCISGWDRTPLFISLLRLSLWADGEIHQSLEPLQILYFTLAWDWMLFGHQLKHRQEKGEEIMFFCFYFLKFIKGENFNTTSKNFGLLPDFTFTRKDSAKKRSFSEDYVETDDHRKLHRQGSRKEQVERTDEVGDKHQETGATEDADYVFVQEFKSSESTHLDAEYSTGAGNRSPTAAHKTALRYRRLTEVRSLFYSAYQKV